MAVVVAEYLWFKCVMGKDRVSKISRSLTTLQATILFLLYSDGLIFPS